MRKPCPAHPIESLQLRFIQSYCRIQTAEGSGIMNRTARMPQKGAFGLSTVGGPDAPSILVTNVPLLLSFIQLSVAAISPEPEPALETSSCLSLRSLTLALALALALLAGILIPNAILCPA